MTTLRVVLDPLIGPPTLGSRYAERLTRALIAYAPEGSGVAGAISAVPDDVLAAIVGALPGLRGLGRGRLGHRELRAAWQHGITVMPGTGLVHATDLMAPLSRHDRSADPDSQTVVTISDAVAWTSPSDLEAREASRRRAMGARAERYADAVVVPTHAVASVVDDELHLGDRVRVIAAGPDPLRTALDDAESLRAAVGASGRYALSVLPDDAVVRRDVVAELAAALPEDATVVLVSPRPRRPDGSEGDGRVIEVPAPDHRGLAALISGAAVYVDLGAEVGFGLPVMEAMSRAVPVVHRARADVDEVVADAGLRVDRAEDLGAAARAVLDDAAAASRLATLGRDRAGAFGWRDAAEKVWQLHADL